jgi:methylamine---glutamate N-methyltransferase subunit B
VAENMMSGTVHVKGFASTAPALRARRAAGDRRRRGLRCGISLKGGDIVVGGSVGSFSAFMAQAGRWWSAATPATRWAIRCTRR